MDGVDKPQTFTVGPAEFTQHDKSVLCYSVPNPISPPFSGKSLIRVPLPPFRNERGLRAIRRRDFGEGYGGEISARISARATGPFKVNGVPLRRVNQAYVIATSTRVDISGVNVGKFNDKYFAKEAKKKRKKGEGEFFEAEKEESKALPQAKKDDQKAVDAQVIKSIEAVPDLNAYLTARFSLRSGMKPHELVF